MNNRDYGVCAICRQPLTAERPTHAVEPNILTGEPGYFDCSNRKPVPLAEAAPEVK